MKRFRRCFARTTAFTWGKNAHEAVHNAVVLEECAKMAARTEMINPDVKPAPQELQDKHYYRKHGANANMDRENSEKVYSGWRFILRQPFFGIELIGA